MKTLRIFQYCIAVLFVCAIIVTVVLGPEVISRRLDRMALGNISLEEKDNAMGGYVYNLSADEKLYVLSNALNNRILPQSDYFASIRLPNNLSNSQTQSYAFQPVYKESEYNSSTKADALAALKNELSALSEKGVIPSFDFNPGGAYDAALFTAIDVLEPKKNVTVWQIGFNGVIIRDGLVDCMMDAQTNKLHSISIRNEKSWEQYDTDKIIRLWADYLGASTPEPYVSSSPLVEEATHYQKYAISGIDGDKTIITVGYYDGIRQFFIKISQ